MLRHILFALLSFSSGSLPQVQHPFQVEGGKEARKVAIAEFLVKNRATVKSHDTYNAVVRKDCPVTVPCICHCACPGVLLATTLPPNWTGGALAQIESKKELQVPLSAPPFFAAPPPANLIPPPPAPAPPAAPADWPGDAPCPMGPSCSCFCHCNYV